MSNKVPQIRFNGYSDAWEDRKLSDIADRFDNLRVPITASDRKPGDTPYYGANGIQDYVEGFTHNGEFILVAEDGANDLKNYPVQYVNGKVWVNNHAHVLQGKKTITDNKFLMNAIKNFNIEPFLVGGGRAKLNADVMIKLNILLPTFVEQEKIGSLFSLLDKTIAIHQRKLDLLKEQKKGYLQKMFPKNGAKVPELRFAGFADDWEERKLRDLLNKNSEKNKNLSVINVESVSNKTGFTKQTDQFEDYSVASADLSNYYVIREKQFAYNPSRINVGSIAYKDLGDEISVVSPLYVSFSTKKVLNDGFLWNWFKTASFDAQRQRLSEGGVRDTLSFNQLSEMNTMFPTYPEQEKIGSFFKQLDNTIALHQRKLELLKEQKKGFLQKMFV